MLRTAPPVPQASQTLLEQCFRLGLVSGIETVVRRDFAEIEDITRFLCIGRATIGRGTKCVNPVGNAQQDDNS